MPSLRARTDTPAAMDGFHPGELAVQRHAEVADQAAALAHFREPELPEGIEGFLAEQPWIVVGAPDADERMWATILYGAPGFVSAPDLHTLRIAARPPAGDALEAALAAPADVGALVIETARRLRLRLNGTSSPDDGGLRIDLQEVYGNCPKYITSRAVTGVVDPPARPARTVGDALDDDAHRLLAAADTMFVATRARPYGADVSHRGGNPGFLQTPDAHTIVWPDYQGNNMFNTFGNLELDPRLGLTLADPDDGATLQVSGTAAVIWDDARIAAFPGAQRLVELTVERTVLLEHAAPLRWQVVRPARNPPAP
jgi:predicted pyridoxine 5'-phosphate oxidase superfamily flavin-nucleotide-binding protein